MPSYPSFLMPTDSVKIRFNEQYVSQGLNMKTGGIVPLGIYQGFDPNVGTDTNVLVINTDGARNDSVAVGDVYEEVGAGWEAKYNITIRSDSQILLDFTGHTVFPVWVVIRPVYSIIAHPFSGSTSATFVTINTLSVDDSDPQALHHGDIKVCRINGLPLTGNIDVTVPTNRDDNGGGLVTQTQLTSLAGLVFRTAVSRRSTAGIFSTTSASYVVVPDYDVTPLSFTLTSASDVVFIVSGGFYCGAGTVSNNTDIGIRVGVTDYDICRYQQNNLGIGGDMPFAGVLQLYLSAGSYLARVVTKWNSIFGAARVENASYVPTALTVLTKG